MAYDCCSLDLNVGAQLDEGSTQATVVNKEELTSYDNALDDAIFELYKKEKVNTLKRKFNIHGMEDLDDLKKKKMIRSDEYEGAQSKSQSHAPLLILCFNPSFRAHGHILSPQVQVDICQCLNKYCIEASSEQRESMIFILLKLVCNYNAPKDDVRNNSSNVAMPIADLSSSPEVVIHEIVTSAKTTRASYSM